MVGGGDAVTIHVKSADPVHAATFKVKRSTKMSKVFAAWAEKFGVVTGTFRYLYDGKRVYDEDTADSLNLDDSAHFDAALEAVGGSS